MYLLDIIPSNDKKHKFKAVFLNENGRTKTVQFGAYGYSDYTQHKDSDRKDRYIARHESRENWDKADTAGALSRWILWNKPTLEASISDYKRRFNLSS